MRVLAVGAHPDDIELGCGGALLRHVAAGDTVTMLVMTSGEAGPQGVVSRIREQEQACSVIGAELAWGGCRDGDIPTGKESVSIVDAAVFRTGAEMIYVHAPSDTHQDHVTTSRAALAAARRTSRILYYQSPSTTSFHPSVFIDVASTLAGKLAALQAHWSQVSQCSMVDLEAVEAGCRYWGNQARIGHAEPFETHRFVWDMGRAAEMPAGIDSRGELEQADLAAVRSFVRG